MPLPESLVALAGSYTGTSTLHLSWNPPGQQELSSDSTLKLTLSPENVYATLHYTWVYEGAPQEGTLLIATDLEKNVAEAAFLDSWHMPFPIMPLHGTADPLAVTGSYSVPDHPDWHWRIELIPNNDTLTLLMTNISPEGEEDWAVRAEYKK